MTDPQRTTIASLLPSHVATFETWTPDLPGDLLPEEEVYVAKAVPKRVDEFRLGRVCARQALHRLGAPAAAIGVHATRAPIWPSTTVGSITHCTGFCASAVAWASDVLAIGIDAEQNQPLPDGVLHQVASVQERRWAGSQRSTVACDRLLFSIKESIFKVWSPLTDAWLGFGEAEVEIDLDSFTFRATLTPTRAEGLGDVPGRLSGRFLVHRGILATAIVVPAAGRTTVS